MRLTLCLEGNGEGRVLASIDMEEIIAHTNIKDTIREIHDRVAKEMYCKGIDDFAERLKACCFMSPPNVRTIELIAEELKESIEND